jgi:hypothetical protein
MACLGAVLHDPATAQTRNTTAALAMTALDTTNLRLTFTVPANGRVLVNMQFVVHGANTVPQILVGVMSGSTVVARVNPTSILGGTALATTMVDEAATFVVPGLTPGASVTWDAAYGVETAVATTAIKWGGPNNATANDAFGGFSYSIWDA